MTKHIVKHVLRSTNQATIPVSLQIPANGPIPGLDAQRGMVWSKGFGGWGRIGRSMLSDGRFWHRSAGLSEAVHAHVQSAHAVNLKVRSTSRVYRKVFRTLRPSLGPKVTARAQGCTHALIDSQITHIPQIGVSRAYTMSLSGA